MPQNCCLDDTMASGTRRFMLFILAAFCIRHTSGELIYVLDWFWQNSLPPQEPLNAASLAVSSYLLATMGITSLTQTGTVDMRNLSIFAPYIDVLDGNLGLAVKEREQNRGDDMLVDVGDVVAQHIDRLQTNSLLQMSWETSNEQESRKYKMHTLGCSLFIPWLRWSAAWNVDYERQNCTQLITKELGTFEDTAKIDKDGKGSDLSVFDSDGPVNAEFGCFQSRSLNNMGNGQQIQGEEGIKLTRYSLGGPNDKYVDLESFTERISGIQITANEVRYTNKYLGTSTVWQFHGHLSVPADIDKDAMNRSVDMRVWNEERCAIQFLHDRSRLRRIALENSILKGEEALIASGKVPEPMTTTPTVLTAAGMSIVAFVATVSEIGSMALTKLIEWNWAGTSWGFVLAMSIEWVAQLISTIPLIIIIYDEALRVMQETTASIIYITTTNYDRVQGLSETTSGENSDGFHLVNMVQVSRHPSKRSLILAIALEVFVLFVGMVYLFSFRIASQMTVLRKKTDKTKDDATA